MSAAGEIEKTVLATLTRTRRVVMMRAMRPGTFSGTMTNEAQEEMTNSEEEM